MLTLSNISKSFETDEEKIIALKDISFEVSDGEFFTIIGPSGSGKSTLLRIIAGLQVPSSGQMHWAKPPKLGFVFQNFALFPFLSVFENIEFGLKMRSIQKSQSKQIVNELIKEVGLTGFESKHPKELSGGMKQRVGLARALAIEPNVLLLDEPFSSLDEFTAEVLRDLTLKLWQTRKITVIMVTHLIREALELSDRIAVLTPQPGTVEQIINNNLDHPRNLRSEDFFKLEDKLKRLIKV